MKLIVGDLVLLIVLVMSFFFVYPYFNLNPNQDSRFAGNSNYFTFKGNDSNVQFNAKQIIFATKDISEIEFFNVTNIKIDNSKIGKRESFRIRYNNGYDQLLSNVKLNLEFNNLTMVKGIYDGNHIELMGDVNKNYTNKLDGSLVLDDYKVKYLLKLNDSTNTWNKNFTNFRQIEFEMDDQSSINFIPENITLRSIYTSKLQIPKRIQITYLLLIQSDGILRLDNHRFDIYNSDYLIFDKIKPETSHFWVDDNEIIFAGITNNTLLNNNNIILSDFDYWLKFQPEIISGFGVFISAFLAMASLYFSYRMKKIEVIETKERTVNILLSEFESNSSILEDLKFYMGAIKKDNSKFVTEFVFLGFKDEGFNAFNNQGGFKYLDLEFYKSIVNCYNSLFKINSKIVLDNKDKQGFVLKYINDKLVQDINSIEGTINELKSKLKEEIRIKLLYY